MSEEKVGFIRMGEAEEAEEIYRAAERAGIKHMTAFNYRFIPAIRFAKC